MRHYLTLTTQTTKNIGDEIQIIAAQQFIPSNSDLETIDRERLSTYQGKAAKLIMNGWYFHDPSYWPPAKSITPLVTSFHLTDLPSEIDGRNPREVVLEKDKVGFLHKNSPIGARDIETYRFFQDNGVASYFSGCLTLTLQPRGFKKNHTVCCVDVSDEVVAYVKKNSKLEVIELHNSDIQPDLPHEEKLTAAQKTLQAYEQADLVISSRLHAVLPSLALGTPAILLHNKNKDASRYLGLKDLVRNCDELEFLAGMYKSELIKATPNRPHFKILANNLRRIISAYTEDKSFDYTAYLALSEENLQTLMWAKEDNEKDLHSFALESLIHKRNRSFKIRRRLGR